MFAYSLDLRERIAAAKQAGVESLKSIAARFSVHPSTVQRHARLAAEGQLAPPKHPAPSLKRAINRPEVQETVRTFIAERNDATLAECCDHLADRTGHRISDSAMCRLLQKLELPRKKKQSMPANGSVPRSFRSAPPSKRNSPE